MNHLAQNKGLDVGRSEAEIVESVDKFILESLSLAGEEFWKILTGLTPLTNANGLILSRTNKNFNGLWWITWRDAR